MRQPRDYASSGIRRTRTKRRAVGRWHAANVMLAAVGFVALINLGFALAHATVAAVEIQGLKIARLETVVDMVSVQLAQKRWWMLPQQVVLFFDTGRIRRLLERQYPFAAWTVSKEVSGTVKIAAAERPAALLWVSGGHVHYLDETGQAFAVAEPPRSSSDASGGMEVFRHQAIRQGLPAVTDVWDRRIRVGDRPLPPSAVRFIQGVAAALQAGAVKPAPEVTGWRYDAGRYQLTVETLAGYEIFFSSNQDVTEQLGKLAAAIEQGILRRPGLRYIDVRFGQKIFYQDAAAKP